MKRSIITLFFAVLASVCAFAVRSFVGFESVEDNRFLAQVENGLVQDLNNFTLSETQDSQSNRYYAISLDQGGIGGTCSIGGVEFYFTNSQSNKKAFNVFDTYIQPDGKDREIRIPTIEGERVNVVLVEAASDVLVNSASQDLAEGDNILTATGTSIVLKTTSSSKPKISAILSLGTPAPTYIDIYNAGYDMSTKVVVCLSFDVNPCNGVVYTGSFNNWSTNIGDCLPMTAVPKCPGWYAVEFPFEKDQWNNDPSGKPIAIPNDGQFSWETQPGRADAWEHIGFNEAQISNSGDAESNVTYPNAGLYMYNIKYWKNHIDPCQNTEKFEYTLNFYAPYLCDALIPAVVGTFNAWTPTAMTLTKDGDERPMYTCTFEAAEGERFVIRATNNFANYQLKYKDNDDWVNYPDIILGAERTITLDCSDEKQYRLGDCKPPVAVTVLVPTDCDVDFSNGIWLNYRNSDGYGSGERVKMEAQDERTFTASFSVSSEYYEIYVLNSATETEDTRKSSRYWSSDEKICLEVSPIQSNNSFSLLQVDCSSLTDHNYRPHHLTATPLTRDSILFEWQVDEVLNRTYYICCYDANNQALFSQWDASPSSRSIRVKAGTPTAVEVAYWTVKVTNDGITYTARGEGFTVQGDDNLPHDITFTHDGEDLYTMRWEGGEEIHHYTLAIYDYVHDDIVTDVTTKSYQLNLAGANTLYVTITAKDENNEELGSVSAERRIYTITFYPPTLCDDIIPALSGTFNNWGTSVMTPVEGNSRACYTAKILAWANDQYKIRGNDGTWNYTLKRRNGEEWEPMEAFTLDWESEITHDCSNVLNFRMGDCAPPVLDEVTATVLVPTDCNMDTPNGLYIAWWPSSNTEDIRFMQMTAVEGRKFSATFAPDDNAYSYYFCNNLDQEAEGYRRTESKNGLSEASLCWEVGFSDGGRWNHYPLLPDAGCSATDHDLRPTGLQAVNSARDTVLFSWDWPDGINNYLLQVYDANDNLLFEDYVYPYDYDEAFRHVFHNAAPIQVSYWKLIARKQVQGADYEYWFDYTSFGEGFTVAGDDRIPHNLILTEKEGNVYTLTWEGSDAVDHYRIEVMADWGKELTDNTSNLTYDLTLEDNRSYSIYVTAMTAEDASYGSGQIYFNNQKQEARDISLYFYLPQTVDFMTEAGCAIVWHVQNLTGESIVPLTADGDNGHWYKATVEQFTREQFYFSLLNAPTKEAATKTITFDEGMNQDRCFLITTNNQGDTILTADYNLYPHDYALTGMQATQELNRMNFSWTANEEAPAYYIELYNTNGARWREWYTEGTQSSVDIQDFYLYNKDTITLTWSVRPAEGEWGNLFNGLARYGQLRLAPSPFVATNLRAENNNDGTFTFTWSPAAYDTVDYYRLYVFDTEHIEVASQTNIQDTTITLPVRLLLSGNYIMRVASASYDDDWNNLGYMEDTFYVAPTVAHDIHFRVLLNPMCDLNPSDGLRLRILKAHGSDTIVNAVKEQYGWWSYTLHTNQYGASINLVYTTNVVRIYGDTCLEYNNRWNEVDCDARATDYFPHHLDAQPNGDGTYNLSWMMDRTERVKRYQVHMEHRDSSWYHDNDRDIEAMQYTTTRLPYSGTYRYIVSAMDDEWNTIGQTTDSFTIEPAEREFVLRVLEQPLDENWQAYRLDIYGDQHELHVDDEGDRWCSVLIQTTDPAVHVRLVAWYGDVSEFWMFGDTCIESNNGFHEVACDAKAQDFTITNAHAEAKGNGNVTFTWDCPDDPDAFYIQTLIRDTVPLTYSYVDGDARSYTAMLNVDTVEQLTWYILKLKHRNGNYYNLGGVYGDTIKIEPSAYTPKNLQYTPNRDGSYTLTWDANPDTVAQYEIRIKYPYADDQESFYTTDTFFVTPIFSLFGAYDVYVLSLSKKNVNMGWQMVRIQVEELEEPRDITLRVLLHPDVEMANPGRLYTYNNNTQKWTIYLPTEEGNSWWSYTFSSTMPVQICYFSSLYDNYVYVTQDTCFQYYGELDFAACDAEAHDYRITPHSFHAESEPGKVTFTWSVAEKSDQYRITAKYTLGDYEDQLFSEEVSDTSFVFLVPDYLDGAELHDCYVRPTAPHPLKNTALDSVLILQKGQIVLSELKAATTDSVTYSFSWEANTDTVYYQVAFTLYEDWQNHPTHLSPVLSEPNYSYTFLSSANQYRNWAVRAVTEQGEPLTAWFPAETSIRLKNDLRAMSNLQSTVEGNIITFTWNSTAPATGCRLYLTDNNYNWIPIIKSDSIVLGNTFTYQASLDGRYEFVAVAYSEPQPGQYQSLGENISTTANYYDAPTYLIQVSATTGGELAWGNPSGRYPAGYHLWLDAYSYEHYRFVGWSDGVKESNRELIVSQDSTLIALFERNKEHTLTLFAGEGGILRYYDPLTSEYADTTQYQVVVEEGAGFSIEAVPAEGYGFYKWSDDNAETYRWINLRSDSTITAYFRPLRYATVKAGDGGRVQVTGGEYNKATKQYKLLEGESLSLKASPDEGYRFVNWSDGDINVNRTLVVTKDTVVTANFAEITAPLAEYIVRILSGNTELGDVSTVSGTYHEGDQLTITAMPKQHAVFTGWSDGNKEATRIITVTQDTTLIASFDYKRFTLTISAGEGGTVNDTTANGIYLYDEWVTIAATPNEHYRFVKWSDGNTNATRYVNMIEDITLTASFAVEQFLVTFLNADDSYIESNWWNYGETPVCSVIPTLEPTEEFEFSFIGWTPEIVPVTGNSIYTATYEEIPRESTGVYNVNDDVKAIKVFRNGQILILRGDKVYTITGQQWTSVPR